MNHIQHHRVTPVLSGTALVLTLLLTVGVLPATARQDAGPGIHEPETTSFCALERVGSQFLACDNLTGNGVPAPAWVDER